jgi:DNA (cytosine-5)-methyltransferase 1
VNAHDLVDEIRAWPELAASKSRDFGRGYAQAIRDVESFLLTADSRRLTCQTGRKLRLLDLYSGAGGAAMGYSRAGFEVVGVDILPMPRYPFEHHVEDALEFLAGHADEFDVIHASPPCQAHSDLQRQNKRTYVNLIPETREMLQYIGKPYVIENVEGAPLRAPVILCGNMFPETRVYRHRLFETNWPLAALPHHEHHEPTFTTNKRSRFYGMPLDLGSMRVQVTGGGNAPVWAKAQAMGIDWMTNQDLNEAIPPAYTEYIGRRLLTHLGELAAA